VCVLKSIECIKIYFHIIYYLAIIFKFLNIFKPFYINIYWLNAGAFGFLIEEFKNICLEENDNTCLLNVGVFEDKIFYNDNKYLKFSPKTQIQRSNYWDIFANSIVMFGKIF